ESYFSNPTGAMVTIKCSPWHFEDKVLLMGDAAHAIVPFFGQGVNCCFEDCTYFNECLERHGANWQNLFDEFESLRKPNTDAIAELALENFIEMRDRVADPKFLLKKKVEQALEQRFPEIFVPKYSLVTFRRGPYSEALERGKVQDHILEELCRSIDRVEEANWEEAEHLLKRYYR
ncbi:FAD-dependent monooxygenase, partial [candidate division KSB1 bacterium]|nr:FAD-dependent monooxygenase [candidate division KSB1 bacterium]